MLVCFRLVLSKKFKLKVKNFKLKKPYFESMRQSFCDKAKQLIFSDTVIVYVCPQATYKLF